MKVICTNIGPAELGGQVEWDGPGANYSQEADTRIKTAFDEEGNVLSREEAGHIFVYQLDDEDRRGIAHKQITKFYPEWKQLNIIRSGSAEEIASMGTFIDACRAWSNVHTNNDPFGIADLTP